MDLAACAKRVFLILEHTQRNGAPRLLKACALPVTARGVVRLVATNLGLFVPAGDHFRLVEAAPGVSIEEIRAATGAPVMEGMG
jgi:acyl CoA:acetate/3-ketoacid CoA transferase beta subunit